MSSRGAASSPEWEAYERLQNGLEIIGSATGEPAAPEPDPQSDDEDVDALLDRAALTDQDIKREIDRLSHLPPLTYQAERTAAAKALGLRVSVVDAYVSKARQAHAQHAETERRRAALDEHDDGTHWPHGFSMRDDGLFYDDGGDNSVPRWLSAPIEVLGEGRDATGQGWCKWLRWHDADGRPHTWPMPMRLLTATQGELEGELVDRGLQLAIDVGSRMLLRRALGEVHSRERVTLVALPGWHAPGGGPVAFVLPNGETFGTATEAIVLKTAIEDQVTVAGTLDDWKAGVAHPVISNPVPVFMLAAAFAGPLIEPLRETSGGFHFFGRSKAGKTLAMKAAVSVWGPSNKQGGLNDWRTTSNALEAVAERCNDGLLPLDEIHHADPREVVGAVYQLANGGGKQRLNRQAVAQRKRTWRSMILSNGEVSIAAMAAKAGSAVLPAGVEVRVPSIQIDADSMWPELGRFASRGELFTHLVGALNGNYGTPIRAFLVRLSECRSDPQSDLEDFAHDIRAAFMDRLELGADAQVRDVARRCGLVAIAGELATKWHILPWDEGEATAAAIQIFDIWKESRGGVRPLEESAHVRVIRAFLSQHGGSRFVLLNRTSLGELEVAHPDRMVLNRAGWRRPCPDEGYDEQFLITRDAWAETCTAAGTSAVDTAKTLLAAGLLIEGDGKNLMKKHRIPGVDMLRLYTVKSTILGSEHASGEDDVGAG